MFSFYKISRRHFTTYRVLLAIILPKNCVSIKIGQRGGQGRQTRNKRDNFFEYPISWQEMA